MGCDTSCEVTSYSRLISGSGSKNIATIALPDSIMENIEEGIVQNPMIRAEDNEGIKCVNNDSEGRKGSVGDIEDEKEEEMNANVMCQRPQSDDLDMNYLSFSSSSSPLHSGSSSYEIRRHRSSSEDCGSEDVLDSTVEERDIDADNTESSTSTKSGMCVSMSY